MRRLTRKFKSRFGPTARSVAVRPELPWYWRLVIAAAFVLLGFGLGYWRYGSGTSGDLRQELARLIQDNQRMHAEAIHVERAQQITTVAQKDLTKDLSALQEENVRLKEDVAFYRSILEDGSGAAVIKLHSFKVNAGPRQGEYQYRLLLVQSGKHDKSVQGTLQLTVNGMKDDKPIAQQIMGERSAQRNGKVNFKYYQPVEGVFVLPPQIDPQSIEARFYQSGSTEPKLTQTVALTN